MKRLLPLWLMVMACAGETFFPESVADAVCGRLATCDPAALQADYGSAADCRDVVYTSMTWFEAEAQGLACTYDYALARDCLQQTRTMACADLEVASVITTCGAAYGCDVSLP